MLVIAALTVLVLVSTWGVLSYNRLVRLRFTVQEGWSTVDVELTRRADLVPNLVATVKGYTAFEAATLMAVTEARGRVLAAATRPDALAADAQLSGALKGLFAVAEAYPQLQANGSFRDLQRELANTEDRIAGARTFYSQRVGAYNTALRTFPTLLVAGLLGFRPEPFFTTESREAVAVQL